MENKIISQAENFLNILQNDQEYHCLLTVLYSNKQPLNWKKIQKELNTTHNINPSRYVITSKLGKMRTWDLVQRHSDSITSEALWELTKLGEFIFDNLHFNNKK